MSQELPNLNERLEAFLKNIDEYIKATNFVGPAFNEEFKIAESLDLEGLDKLTQDDCFNYGFMLYQYADSLGSEMNKQRTVQAWCERNLNELVGREVLEMSQYVKHEMKVGAVMRENTVAGKLGQFLEVAKSRADFLQQKEYNVRRKAECLIEKGKRK